MAILFFDFFRFGVLKNMSLKGLIFIGCLFYLSVSGDRVKRHLVFNKGSKLFFSLDVRDNLFDYYKLFAHVFGFKIDWDLPHRLAHESNIKKIQRRDLYRGMQHFFDRQNLNGTSCVQKFICEAVVLLQKRKSFLAQFYEIIFTPNHGDADSNILQTENDCLDLLNTKLSENCPFSLVSIAQGNSDLHVIKNYR